MKWLGWKRELSTLAVLTLVACILILWLKVLMMVREPTAANIEQIDIHNTDTGVYTIQGVRFIAADGKVIAHEEDGHWIVRCPCAPELGEDD